MALLMTMIGALFLLAGTVFGVASVFWGTRLRYRLFGEHNNEVSRKPAAPIDSENLWRYVKSQEGNDIPEILGYKNRIKRSFMLFCIFSLMGIASFLTALVASIVS